MNDAEWQALVRAMDEPAWAIKSCFETNEGRLAHHDALDQHIAEWTHGQDDYALMALLQAAGVRAAICQKPSDRVSNDPQFAAREWWTKLPHAELGDAEFDGVVPRLGETPGAVRTPSPLLGEHTHEVLRDVLGLSDDEIEEAEMSGALM
jgi:crotonobetainyl-CoA:carnitine CoA-transferase CaiB-like acyl-CoA transferase